MSPRQEAALAVAREIVRLERRIEVLRARFDKLVGTKPGVTPARTLKRPTTIAEVVLDMFARTEHEIPAGTVAKALPGVSIEVVHTTLSKLARRGLLERVRFGVYRRARQHYVPAHDDARARSVSARGGTDASVDAERDSSDVARERAAGGHPEDGAPER